MIVLQLKNNHYICITKTIKIMKKTDFNNGDRILIEMTTYKNEWLDGQKAKPTKVVSRVETIVSVDTRGRRTIEVDGASAELKDFKKGECVKGSFGMSMWKSSWLNHGFIVIGGLEAIRDEKLQSLLDDRLHFLLFGS